MIHIDIHELQSDPSPYLERVARGETIVLMRDDEPIIELRPVASRVVASRPIGLAKGTFEIPASFFDPLPVDVVDSFYGPGS